MLGIITTGFILFIIIFHFVSKVCWRGNFLEVQWLELHTATKHGPGSIPGGGTKIPKAVWRDQKKIFLIK